MTTPFDDAEDRAIARALDADDDAGAVDSAADEYRTVLSHLTESASVPADLEDRVMSAALERRPADVPAFDRSARRRSVARRLTLATAAVAGAAVISLMVMTADNPERALGGRIEEISDNFTSVVEAPGTRMADLMATDEGRVGTAALATDGAGVMYDLDLPAPASSQVLWVWLATSGAPVRLGPIADPTASEIGFRVTGDTDLVEGIAISAEPAGITPSVPGPVIVAGTF